MSSDDKVSQKADELKGHLEEAAGNATDDRGLEHKGQRDQAGAKLHQAADKAKDAAKDILDR